MMDHIARQFLADKYDGLTAPEKLTKLYERDPQAAREIMASMFAPEDDEKQRLRANLKADADAKDRVHWGVSINLPVPDHGQTFDTFVSHPDIRPAYDAVQRWVSLEGPGMLVLAGSPGVGKSHLCAAAIHALKASGHHDGILYVRTENVLQSILQEAVGNKRLAEVMEELCGVPRLILDDFGATAGKDWYRSQLDEIIDARWENAASVRTLVATNLLAKDLPPRIASRLADKTRAVNVAIAAGDYRQVQT